MVDWTKKEQWDNRSWEIQKKNEILSSYRSWIECDFGNNYTFQYKYF